MAYFLGKGIDAPLDDLIDNRGPGDKATCIQRCKEQMRLNPGFDYRRCIEGCGGMSISPGEISIPEEEKSFEPVPTETPFEAAPTEANWLDNLITGIFGREFETIRGVGARSRESVFDALAREGLLGTGATRGVAEDIAWQTERGISDLLRDVEQIKYGREQEALNMLLTYLFSQMGAWR